MFHLSKSSSESADRELSDQRTMKKQLTDAGNSVWSPQRLKQAGVLEELPFFETAVRKLLYICKITVRF